MIVASLLLLAAPKWEPLFNGKSLGEFSKLGGTAEFRVDKGELVGVTKPNTPNTFLATRKMYGDFELEYEVKVDPKLNSGVQIRSNSYPGFKNGQVHGYQIEIDPSDRAWSGGFYEEGRRGWIHDLSRDPKAQKAFKNGAWNKFKVHAKGDHFQVWVNGVKTADVKDALTSYGFIAFQVHSVGDNTQPMEVRWKNVRIKDLGIPTAQPSRGGKWLLRKEADASNWTTGPEKGPIKWKWDNDSLVVNGTGSIQSKESFGDFQLHVEFMTDDNGLQGQANGNSGVYLQQRYEIQVLNSAPREPQINECASIYNVKAPDFACAFPAYQWQAYDIYFKAARFADGKKTENARVTLYHNGTLVHNNVELQGPTGAGAPESEVPLPISIQDHGNAIRYRNIWVKKM